LEASLRFYLDENVPVAVADQLRRRGIEAVTVRALGMLSDTDVNHLNRATQNGYVLCTYDSDYVELAAGGFEHAGIVLGQPEIHWIGEWVKSLELMHAVYTPDEMKNRVEYLWME
jgi:predicted nuclease of predicted toxin-antitoxin system